MRIFVQFGRCFWVYQSLTCYIIESYLREYRHDLIFEPFLVTQQSMNGDGVDNGSSHLVDVGFAFSGAIGSTRLASMEKAVGKKTGTRVKVQW